MIIYDYGYDYPIAKSKGDENDACLHLSLIMEMFMMMIIVMLTNRGY